MTDKERYDKKYEESIKDDLYFIAQNLPDEISIDSAYHFPGYDFDIVLKHEDFENGYALSSYRVKDRIENETLVDWIKNRQEQFEKHQSSGPPKRRRR